MNWSISSCYIAGKVHLNAGQKCQDYVRVNFNGNTAVVIVTDGVSSSKYAFEASHHIADKVMEQILLRGDDVISWADNDFSQWLMNVVNEWLRDECLKLQCDPRDVDTTLMIYVSNGEKFIAGSIGDGLIGVNIDGHMEVLIEPEYGRFANTSYFVATSDFVEHFRVIRGVYDSRAVYFMLTDGSCDCLYDNRDCSFASALDKFCEWARDYDRTAVNPAIRKVMSELFVKKTTDDCAVALIARRN